MLFGGGVFGVSGFPRRRGKHVSQEEREASESSARKFRGKETKVRLSYENRTQDLIRYPRPPDDIARPYGRLDFGGTVKGNPRRWPSRSDFGALGVVDLF